ncbi:MAG: hypothetical protein KJ048_05735 [Dehalococcoidia bacterium]|nr:hypothetical protein [Dehalococcoidia bacterium]
MNYRRLLGGGILGAAVAAITVISAVAAFDGNTGTGEDGRVDPGADDSQAVQRDMRRDLARRLGVDVESVSIQSFDTVTWPDGCMGVHYAYATCLAALTDGFVAILADGEGQTYVYHGSRLDFVAVSFLDTDEAMIGEPVSDEPEGPGGRVADPRWAVQQHLAGALGIAFEDVAVESFEAVQWPDGCRGVYFHDTLCTLAAVDGWRATATVPGSDRVYLYHGQSVDAELVPEGDYFTAVWELDPAGYRLGEPLMVGG